MSKENDKDKEKSKETPKEPTPPNPRWLYEGFTRKSDNQDNEQNNNKKDSDS